MPSAARTQALPRRRRPFDASKLYGISGFTGLDYLKTAVGGGEAGVATGFVPVALVRLRVPQTISACFFARTDGASGGWQFSSAPGTMRFYAYDTAFRATAGYTFTPADIGRLFLFLGYDATTLLRFFSGPGEAPGTQAMTTYTPANVGTSIGINTSQPGTPFDVLETATFRGSPSNADLRAFVDAARNANAIPTTMTNATLTHRWSLKDELAKGERGAPATSGQIVPRSLPDTVTAAAVDSMARVGTPTINVIDPAAYPASTYGVFDFTTSSHLKTTVAPAVGATFTLEFEATFYSALAGGQHFLSNATGSSVVGGFSVYQSANTLNVYSYGPGVNVLSATIATTGLGYKRTIRVEYTGTVWRLWIDGVQQGSDVTGAYTASTSQLYVGTFGDGTVPTTNMALFKIKFGAYGQPTQHVWDPTLDIAGSATVPATILDRGTVGGSPLTRVGTGLLVSAQTDRLWSYETTPVNAGFVPNASTTFYDSTATGHDGGSSGKSVALLFRVNSQSVNKPRELFSLGPGTTQVMYIRASGAMATLQAGWLATAPSTQWNSTPMFSILAADVGQMLLFVTTFDLSIQKVKAYWKRAEVLSPGTNAQNWANNYGGTGSFVRLGHLQNNVPTTGFPTYFAEETTIFGAMTFDGVWTVNEINALYDGVASDNDLRPLPAARMGHYWSFKTAFAGSYAALPATVADGAGSSPLTRVGAPTLAQHYVHAPKF